VPEFFSIAFEQVELVNGLAPDQPVWLFLRATLKDSARPDVVLDVREVGSFPPDANRLAPPDIVADDSGLYAPGLQIAVAARNDTNIGTGQVFPRFALDSIAVADGQQLEVEVFMLPRVWFRQMTVDQDDLDAWSRAGFLALLGASGFGLAGAVIGGVLGGIWGTEDVDVTVPCYQTVISARHVFTLDDLRALAAEPMRRFGPNDNVPGVCGFIDSFYWLSANQHVPWSFGPSQPVEPQDCTLRPWRHEPAGEWLQGTWLDRDSWQTSCLGVVVNVEAAGRADVYVYDHPHGGGGPPREFLNRRIEKDLVPSAFTFNYFGGDCPVRSAKPTCPNCKRFTNLPHAYFLPKAMIAALALGPRHIGADGWGESLLRSGLNAPKRDCLETERLRKLTSKRDAEEAAPFAPGILFRPEGKDHIALWPTGTPPPQKTMDQPVKLDDLVASRFHDGVTIADLLFGCFKIILSEREILFTYAEVPARGAPTCARLRYMLWDEEGRVVKDVMLQPWFKPPS
jgi:hypothetical protein